MEFQVEGHTRYGVSSGIPLKLMDLVDKCEKVIGRKLPIKWAELTYRQREVMIPWRNYKKLTGWSPKISLETGLKDLLLSKNEQ